MDGVEVMMLSANLFNYAEELVKSTGLPVTTTYDRQGASHWEVELTHGQWWQIELGVINHHRKNIIQQGDGSKLNGVTLPPLDDEYNYAIVLHEMGHSIGRTTAEMDAWTWAYNHSEVWTPEMQRAAREGMMSYVLGGHFTQFEIDEFLLTMPVKEGEQQHHAISSVSAD